MPTLKDYKKTETIKVLAYGWPKGSGKSTLAMGAPGKKLLLQYDLGSPTVPPGVDVNDVFLRLYPSAEVDIKPDSDKWKRAKNVGEAIIQDVHEVRDAVIDKRRPVLGGEEVPWVLTPNDTVIMDGMVQWSQTILDWVLRVNAKYNPEDFGNAYAAWGKRLNQSNIILNMIIPLPVNVVLTTWAKAETESRLGPSGKPVQVETGRIIPDLGGKLDIWGPGKVDNSIYLYSQKRMGKDLEFLARVKPNANVPYVGRRNVYTQDDVIDITITPDDQSSPWSRLFGTN